MVWRISPMRAPSLAAGRSSGAGRSQNPAMRLAAASRRRSRMRPRWRTTSRTPLRRTGAVLRSLTGSCAAEVDRFHQRQRTVNVAPAIVALQRKAEEIRIAEIERLHSRLGVLNADQIPAGAD